jgi:hypothetical protein
VQAVFCFKNPTLIQEVADKIIGSNFTIPENDLGNLDFQLVGLTTLMNLMKAITKQDLSQELNYQIEQTVGEMTAYISIRGDETMQVFDKNQTFSQGQLEKIDLHKATNNVFNRIVQTVGDKAERVRQMRNQKNNYPSSAVEMQDHLIHK